MPHRDADHLRTKIAPRQSDTTPLNDTDQGSPTATGPWVDLGSAAPAIQPGKIGRFEIRDVLGKGSFGIVYRGFDSQLQREVAIKVPRGGGMDSDQVEAFLREARAAANIHHQNVCPVYEVGIEAGRPFIVMHVVSNTLAKVLKGRKTPFVPRDAAAIVRKLALGVAAAHALDVTHRDLKPANILVQDATNELLITDFGLALLADETRASVDGDTKGTPAYMAPEQARGEIEKIGPLSDIYALGVILYEMLTKTLPFRGLTTDAVLSQVRHEPPTPPSRFRPGLDKKLEAIVLKAMAKQPQDRYPSAKDFANALAEYVRQSMGPTGGTIKTPPKPAPSKPPAPTPAPVKPPPIEEIIEVVDSEEPLEAEELSLATTAEEQQLLDAVTALDRPRIRKLIESGVNVNARCDQGASVLYYACLTADTRLVKYLIDLGADVNLRAEGEAIEVYAPKPLDLVMQSMFLMDWTRYRPIFDLLLKYGATDFNDRVPTPLESRTMRERADEQKRSGRPVDKASWWQFWK